MFVFILKTIFHTKPIPRYDDPWSFSLYQKCVKNTVINFFRYVAYGAEDEPSYENIQTQEKYIVPYKYLMTQ